MSLHAKLRKKALPHLYSLPKRREEGDFFITFALHYQAGEGCAGGGKACCAALVCMPFVASKRPVITSKKHKR